MSTYDEVKNSRNGPYKGMEIGNSHLWDYKGEWLEQKKSPCRWNLKFDAIKGRRVAAPPDSGVTTGTKYHWYIIANQIVEKINDNQYETHMNGVKFLLGYKKPSWQQFSYEYPHTLSPGKAMVMIHDGFSSGLSNIIDCKENKGIMELIDNALRNTAPPPPPPKRGLPLRGSVVDI